MKSHKLLSLKIIKYIFYLTFKILPENLLEVNISIIVYFVGIGFYSNIFLYILPRSLFILKLNFIILSLYLLFPVYYFVCCFICHYIYI